MGQTQFQLNLGVQVLDRLEISEFTRAVNNIQDWPGAEQLAWVETISGARINIHERLRESGETETSDQTDHNVSVRYDNLRMKVRKK